MCMFAIVDIIATTKSQWRSNIHTIAKNSDNNSNKTEKSELRKSNNTKAKQHEQKNIIIKKV